MPYEGMTATYAANLEQGSMVISCLFIAEMGIKVTGLGCAGYWSDGWNVRKIQVLERDAILLPGRILMPKYELTC
jgi:hypothetical protein